MYKTFYGLEMNPFVKELKTEYCYESKDYNEVKGRLKYLKEIKGIGLFIGSSGLGKTFSIRCFTEKLNKDLYKVIYISPTRKMRVFEFFAQIAGSLNIDTGACYKNEMYEKNQFVCRCHLYGGIFFCANAGKDSGKHCKVHFPM